MAKIKAVKFHSDFCEQGEIKYEAGKTYPKNSDTERCVILNFGEVVTVEEKIVIDPQAAEKAAADQAATDKATAIADAEAALEKAKSDYATVAQAVIAAYAAVEAEQDEVKKAEFIIAAQAADDAAHAADVEVQASQQRLDALLAA